jgi:hypothetical protein
MGTETVNVLVRKKILGHKGVVFLLQKCAKTHLRTSVNSNFFRSYNLDPRKRGRDRDWKEGERKVGAGKEGRV